MKTPKRQQILEMLRKKGILRPRDLEAAGISGVYLNKLQAEGVVVRAGRGLYTLPDAEPSEHQSAIEACKRVSRGVVCLLSALRFHELTTQAPFEVWLAIGTKARLPKFDYPPMRIVRFSQSALTFGVEQHTVDGAEVRVYSAAKTVADCFKYRHKIGLDVALEALRDCRKQKRASMDEIWEAAKVCRMSNVIRPYMEAMA